MSYFWNLFQQAMKYPLTTKSLELEKLDSRDLSGITDMKNLESLRLRHIKWSFGFYYRLPQHLVNLEKLVLQTCRFDQTDIAAFCDYLIVTEKLKKLSIENCNVKSDQVTQILESVRQNRSLEWLGLVNVDVNKSHEDLLAEIISTHPTLKFLDLTHTSISDSQGKLWTAFDTSPQVKAVFVHECDFIREELKDSYDQLNRGRRILSDEN